MERTLKDTTTLYLYRRQYITYLSICPSIQMLVRRIKELGYLVVVHLHPSNNFWLIPNSNGCSAVTVKDTVLVITPIPSSAL